MTKNLFADRNGIRDLSWGHWKVLQRLEVGYSTVREKLHHMFFDGQEEQVTKEVITEYFEQDPIPERDQKGKYKRRSTSKRVFDGRIDVRVVYPRSHKVYGARVRVGDGLVAIEPIKENRAFWLVNRCDYNEADVLDLNVVPNIRQYHNHDAKYILDNFR
jgi:hypothetical protein